MFFGDQREIEIPLYGSGRLSHPHLLIGPARRASSVSFTQFTVPGHGQLICCIYRSNLSVW